MAAEQEARVTLADQMYQDTPVSMSARTIKPLGMAMDWFTIMIIGTMWLIPAVAVTIIGNFWWGIAAGLIGNTIGVFVVMLMGIPSFKYGLPNLTITRSAFGRTGADVPAVLQAIMMIFWTWVQTILGAIAADDFCKLAFGGSSYTAWVLVIGVISAVVCYFGFRRIVLFERIAFPILLVVFVGVFVILLAKYNIPQKITEFNAGGGGVSWGGWLISFELVFATMVTWALMPGDFTRFSTTMRAPKIGLPIGIFLGANLLVPIAAVGVVATGGEVDPGTVMASLAEVVGKGWSIVFLVGFVLATITTNFATIYCAGVSLSTIKRGKVTPKFVRWVFVAIGIVTVVGALYSGWLNVETWVIYMASFLAPTCGIVIGNHFFVENRRKLDGAAFLNRNQEMRFKKGFNIVGIVTWLLGLGIYWLGYFFLPQSLQSPMFISLIVSAVVYVVWARRVNVLSAIPESVPDVAEAGLPR